VRPGSVSIGSVFDGYHGDPALVIVDAVDNSVVTAAGAMQSLEA
jgi:hypothetical protein